MTPKLPFMPFYGADFYESEKVGLMDAAEQGVYLRLLWRQWREGSLPLEVARMAQLAGVPTLSARVAECFPAESDGRRRNRRLEEIRQEQEAIREKKASGGRLGRARQLAQADPGHTPGSPRGVLGQSESESEPDNNTHLPARPIAGEPRWGALTAGLGEPGASALAGYRHASRNPDRLLVELESLVNGLHGPGGRAVPYPALGRALHDMSLAGVEMSAKRLAAFCRSAMEPEVPTRNGHQADDTEARMAAWTRRKEAERAERRTNAN